MSAAFARMLLWFNTTPAPAMLRFLLTRISLIIPTFIGMTLLAFFLIRLVPGGSD